MFELVIAQVSDTHVVDPKTEEELFVDNNGRLASAVASIMAETERPAAVLLTGDLTNWSKPVEYEALAELLAPLDMPLLALPGNHDEARGVKAAFPDLPWADGDHASWVIHVDHVRIVGLDTSAIELDGAMFDEERETWLRSVLAEPHDAGPTVLAMHHPPFLTGIAWMDASGFVGLDRLVALLEELPVDRILCGHLHRPIQSSVAGIPAQVGISTVQHVALDLTPDSEVSLINAPAGYHLHCFHGNSSVSHTRYINVESSAFRPGWAG